MLDIWFYDYEHPVPTAIYCFTSTEKCINIWKASASLNPNHNQADHEPERNRSLSAVWYGESKEEEAVKEEELLKEEVVVKCEPMDVSYEDLEGSAKRKKKKRKSRAEEA